MLQISCVLKSTVLAVINFFCLCMQGNVDTCSDDASPHGTWGILWVCFCKGPTYMCMCSCISMHTDVMHHGFCLQVDW